MEIAQNPELISVVWFFLFVILVIFLAKAITYLVHSILEHFAEKTKTKLDDLFVKDLTRPFYVFTVLLGLKIAGEILDLNYNELVAYNSFLNFCIAIICGYFLIKFMTHAIGYFFKSKIDPAEKFIDHLGLEVIEKIMGVFIIVFMLLIYLVSINIDVLIVSLFTLVLFTGFLVVSTWYLIEIGSYISLIHQEKIKRDTIIEFKEINVMGKIRSFKINKIHLEDEFGNEILVPASYLRNHAFRVITHHKKDILKNIK